MNYKVILILALSFLLTSCHNKKETGTTGEAPKVYTKSIEDTKAAPIVAKMMEAMGGADKWEKLDYVSWTFFGARHLVWDKKNDRVRIESPKDSSIYLVNLKESTGRYTYNGIELKEPSALAEKIKKGKDIWINDMYWLFMPFKLYDKGVTVKHSKVDTTLAGAQADVLQLTFDKVGNTPENKYEIFVDKSDHLIKQWNFFAKADQEEPSRVWPWDNYQNFDGLLLSADRSDESGPSNVKIYDTIEDSVFTSFVAFKFY